MSSFYTNVSLSKNDVLLRGYEDGVRVHKKIPYKPYLFVPGRNKSSGFKTFLGAPVEKKEFDSIRTARQFLKSYSQVSNSPIYGLDKFEYLYIYDNYPGEIRYDKDCISQVGMDIEIDIIGHPGFPDIRAAEREVTLVTLSKLGHKYVFGCKPYTNTRSDVTYTLCKDEADLFHKMLETWSNLDPDVVTGWNIEHFDVPYLINRMIRVVGERVASRLSPWRELREMKVFIRGKEVQIYNPVGVNVIDYLPAYKSFSYTPQESYSLDHIAFVELGERKLDYGEYGSLAELQKQNWQMYTDYNIRDVDLVDKIDERRRLISQIISIAYIAKTNYLDAFRTVRSWDVIIHNYLMERGLVIPPLVQSPESRSILGGYVKDPKPGMYRWVVSLDLNSLYPSIIQQYNISPETFRGKLNQGAEVDIEAIVDRKLEHHRQTMLDENITVTANMLKFTRDFQGFLPAIMEQLYNRRVIIKNLMLEKSSEFERLKESGTDAATLELLEREIIQLDGDQQSLKILLNSGYGALANSGNRWHSTNFAESITSSGQATTRWIEKKLNDYLNQALETKNVDYVIACDTDSVYVCMEEVIKKVFPDDEGTVEAKVKYLDKLCKKVLEPFIDKSFDELGVIVNAYKQRMKMKRECIADVGIWTGKKHYVLNVYNKEGVSYTKPKLKMMGIEAVRTSTPAVCRQAIKEALEIIVQKDESAVQEYIESFRQRFFKMSFQEVAFPRTVSNVSSYYDPIKIFAKGSPIQASASLIYNNAIEELGLTEKYEKIEDQQKIRFAYLLKPNPLKRAKVIACPDNLPPEFGLEKYIDYNTQFEKSFLKPIELILSVIGWRSEETSGIQQFLL